MNNVKRYIPERVYEKIKTLNFKNKDHLYVVCDMIYRSSIYKKTDNYDGFQDIPSYYFENIIKNYKEYVTYLIDNQIIECDNVYSKQAGKSLGYKYNDEYVSILMDVFIDKLTLKKRIINNKNKRNDEVKRKLKTYKDNYLNNFKIDYDSAIDYLNNSYQEALNVLKQSKMGLNWVKPNPSTLIYSLLCSPKVPGRPQVLDLEDPKIEKRMINRYNSYYIALSSINDNELFFRKNKTNGRIDTNLTNLKSQFKRFIKYDGNLYQIDIKNSQPFILSLYLNLLLTNNPLTNEQKIELEKYSKWTSKGIYYEEFTKTYFNKTGKVLSRKDIKNIMFCIFFSKNGSYTPQKKIFKSIFPFILSTIEKMKENKHNEFAIKLQKIESEICIDIICQELDNEDIKYWTIHDAYLVDEKQIDKVTNIIKEQFKLKWGVSPELKIEKI